jgi:hypothetical protein
MRVRPQTLTAWCALALISSFMFDGKFTRDACAIDLPAAGMNLAAYNYWGTALPFVDVAHMSDRWYSVPPNLSTWNDGRVIALASGSYPALLEPNQIACALLFTYNKGVYPTGSYVLEWTGNGDVALAGPGVSVVNNAPGQITYNVSSTNLNGLLLEVTRTDPTNPVRNISVRAPLSQSGNDVFNPVYKSDLAHYGVIRYMDWNRTNNNTITKWTARSVPSDFLWGSDAGVPYEYQIKLSNELGQDLWLTVPHLADDSYVQHLAGLVKQQLSPGLRVWVEYSNEIWNPTFQQYNYANDVLRPLYGVDNSLQAYGRRSAEIFDIFSQQFNDPSRVVRVIAGQAANSWVLDQELIGATVGGVLKADVAAIAPYFTADIDQLYQQHLLGTVDLDQVFAELDQNIDALATSIVANRNTAASRGLPLAAYEGGQSIVARLGAQHNDADFVALLTEINHDPRMGQLYTHLLDKWYGAGGQTFAFFNDMGTSSKWGAWGLQEDYTDGDSVKLRAVRQYLQELESRPVDFNTDGLANQGDFNVWNSTFASTVDLRADASKNQAVDATDYVLWRRLTPVYQGDFDGDHQTDLNDYDLWQSSFGSTTYLYADGDKNAKVDTADYVLWRRGYVGRSGGVTGVNAGLVPEPGGSMLLLPATLLFLLVARFPVMRRGR